VGETRKIAAILMADVVGYSRLAGADEDRTLSRLRGLRSDLIDPAIAAHHGRTVKRTGDGSLIEFRSVVDAVRCAIEMQNGMVDRNAGVPPERQIALRVGIHLGDVVEEADGDLMGDGVNIAARLEQLCPPGGLVVSGTAYDQLLGKLNVPLEFIGEQQVKNISRPVRVYEVRFDGTRLRRKLPLRSLSRAAGLLVALLITGVVLFWWNGRAEKPLTTPSLAVLPFKTTAAAQPTPGLLMVWLRISSRIFPAFTVSGSSRAIRLKSIKESRWTCVSSARTSMSDTS
jgi:class 3 adenylate cyclase